MRPEIKSAWNKEISFCRRHCHHECLRLFVDSLGRGNWSINMENRFFLNCVRISPKKTHSSRHDYFYDVQDAIEMFIEDDKDGLSPMGLFSVVVTTPFRLIVIVSSLNHKFLKEVWSYFKEIKNIYTYRYTSIFHLNQLVTRLHCCRHCHGTEPVEKEKD